MLARRAGGASAFGAVEDAPRLDGVDVVRSMRAIPRHAAVPAVAVSAYGTEEDQRETFGAAPNWSQAASASTADSNSMVSRRCQSMVR